MSDFKELCSRFEETIKDEPESKLEFLRQEATNLLINAKNCNAVRGATTAIYLIDQEFERRYSHE